MEIGPPPTEEQKRQLCEIMYQAFLEIRVLGWQGNAEQAADLADAFHNLPIAIYAPYFSWEILRMYLQSYQKKYPREAGTHWDYVGMLEHIQKADAPDA